MIVTLGGFARWFLLVGLSAGLGLGLWLGTLLEGTAAAFVGFGAGLTALVLVRAAVQLRVKPTKEEHT